MNEDNSLKPYHDELIGFQKKYLQRLLERFDNISEAAAFAGIHRTHLYKMAKRCGVSWPSKKRKNRGKWDRPIPTNRHSLTT